MSGCNKGSGADKNSNCQVKQGNIPRQTASVQTRKPRMSPSFSYRDLKKTKRGDSKTEEKKSPASCWQSQEKGGPIGGNSLKNPNKRLHAGKSVGKADFFCDVSAQGRGERGESSNSGKETQKESSKLRAGKLAC